MKKPILVVMAAGMGSRYGGLKQIDPVGSHGEVIMDYSLYDVRRAGFEKVIFIIKHSIEEQFKEKIGNHISKYMDVDTEALDIQITQTQSEDGKEVVPALFANIPIKDIKNGNPNK